jgi:hypothetical protein
MVNPDLIEELKKAKYWEDEYILKYDTDEFWVLLKTLPKDKFAKLELLFKENLADTRKHKKMIEVLLKNFEEGKYGQ